MKHLKKTNMKGTLLKSKALTDEWMVRYTTYRTIPGVKGVIGSHSRLPESNYIPIHPDHILYLGPGDNGSVINFEIVEQFMPYDNLNPVHKFAKLINEENNKKRSKQKKHTSIMEANNIKRMYTEEDLMSAFNAGINNDYGNGPSFDQWLNSLNKD